jgi:Family of unknown function (DUF6186)
MTSRALVIAGFGALALLAVAAELIARRDPRRATLGAVLTGALSSRVGRVIIAGAWLWAGFHFLAH